MVRTYNGGFKSSFPILRSTIAAKARQAVHGDARQRQRARGAGVVRRHDRAAPAGRTAAGSRARSANASARREGEGQGKGKDKGQKIRPAATSIAAIGERYERRSTSPSAAEIDRFEPRKSNAIAEASRTPMPDRCEARLESEVEARPAHGADADADARICCPSPNTAQAQPDRSPLRATR